jgi:Protein of unknown function (DUF3465)
MKKILIVIIVGFAVYGFFETNPNILQASTQQSDSNDQQIIAAFQNRQSNLQVGGAGIVVKTLADDTEGGKHQKFILKLSSGQTLLIAHNIDLAPRINTLRTGDTIEFYGEYEWNSKGGVVHWTHRDPASRHEHGWLKHKEILYR